MIDGTERLAVVTFGFVWRVRDEYEAINRASILGQKTLEGMRLELERAIELDPEFSEEDKAEARALMPKLMALLPPQVVMLPEEVVSGP